MKKGIVLITLVLACLLTGCGLVDAFLPNNDMQAPNRNPKTTLQDTLGEKTPQSTEQDADDVVKTTSEQITLNNEKELFQILDPYRPVIACVDIYCYLVKEDGSLWFWENEFKEMPKPSVISGINDVVSVYGGDGCVYALKSDGTLWSWGINWYGQLGDGTTISRDVPQMVDGLENVSTIVSDTYVIQYAIKSNGEVWAFGSTAEGDVFCPKRVPYIESVKSIVGNVMLKNDGTIWDISCKDTYDNSEINCDKPFDHIFLEANMIEGLSNVESVYNVGYFNYAKTLDGNLWGWGWARWYDGVDMMEEYLEKPTLMKNAYGLTSFSTKTNYCIRSDGSLWQRKDDNDIIMKKVPNISQVIYVLDCYEMSYAVTFNGDIYKIDGILASRVESGSSRDIVLTRKVPRLESNFDFWKGGSFGQ